jgi:hypothetical protein
LRKDQRDDASGPGGRDLCAEVRMELVGLTPAQASLRITFSAPDSSCLKPRKPWVEAPVEQDAANNYQQVSCVRGLCSVRWGQERTVVDAILDRRTGTLLSVAQEDVRVLKERTGCDSELEHCSPEAPLLLRRRFSMKLREAALWQEP